MLIADNHPGKFQTKKNVDRIVSCHQTTSKSEAISPIIAIRMPMTANDTEKDNQPPQKQETNANNN